MLAGRLLADWGSQCIHKTDLCGPPIGGSETESPTFHHLLDRGTGEICKTSFPGVSARELTYSTLLGAELVIISIVLAWPENIYL